MKSEIDIIKKQNVYLYIANIIEKSNYITNKCKK